MVFAACVTFGLTMVLHSAAASSTFSPSPYLDVCPGGVAEFTCTVEDDDTLEGTLWHEAAIDCIVLHTSAPFNRSCGPFHLTLNPPVENSYTSVLSISSVSLALNNTEVQCRGPSVANVVGSSSLRIIAPPTAPSFLPLSPSDFTGQDSSLQVTLHWTAPVVYPQPSDAAVSRYVITSDQAGTCAQGGCVVSPGGPGFSQREYTLGNLPLSQDYTFTVRADNCEMGDNFQSGMESDGLVLSLQLPAMPDCGSVPVYDSNDQLVSIETNWTAVVAPVSEVAPNVSGDVVNYVLRVAEVAQSTEVLDPSEVCGVSGCSYRVNNTFAGDSGQYTVILQARNIVGTGLQGECGTIGLMNTVVDVTPRTTDASSPVVQCVFSQLAPGSVASCTVCFGTDRSSLVNCSSSVGSTHEVIVALPRLLATTRYFYRTEASIDGSIVAAVEGTFATECGSADLGGSSDPTLHQQCSSTSAGSVSVPNGAVCYTGTSAGSTATYQCDGSHTVFSAEDTRTCQSDGNWNGAVQTCVFVGLRGWHVALTVLGVVSWVAAAALTVVAFVLILCARKPASLFWWHWLYIVLLVVNAVLLLVSAVLWIVFGAVVDNPRGHAAALTDYLVLRDALCAVTFALSLVALLLVIAAVVLVHVIKKSTSPTAKSVEMVEKEFEGLAYPGQQEEDEFRETAHVQARLEQKKAPAYPTRELVPVTREEAAARKKDEKEAVYHTTNHKATESTDHGATGGGEYSALDRKQGKGGRDKGPGHPPSTSKQVNIPNEYQALNRGAGETKKNAPPPPPPPPSEEYDTLQTAGLPPTTTTAAAAAGGPEYGKVNPQEFQGMSYHGQQEEDEVQDFVFAFSQKKTKERESTTTQTAILLMASKKKVAAKKKATESTGATGGGENSALEHSKGGRDKGPGQQSSTSKQVNIHPQPNEDQAASHGAGESKKTAPPPPLPPSEQYDTLGTAGLPQTTTTTTAAGGVEYGKLNPQPDGGKKGKAGRGKAHPPPSAEYSQLDTTSRSTEGSTAQVVVEYAEPNTGARYAAQTSQ